MKACIVWDLSILAQLYYLSWDICIILEGKVLLGKGNTLVGEVVVELLAGGLQQPQTTQVTLLVIVDLGVQITNMVSGCVRNIDEAFEKRLTPFLLVTLFGLMKIVRK